VTDLLDQQIRHTQRHTFAGFVVVYDGMLLAHRSMRSLGGEPSQLASDALKGDNQPS
jgi:hypothetical protein